MNLSPSAIAALSTVLEKLNKPNNNDGDNSAKNSEANKAKSAPNGEVPVLRLRLQCPAGPRVTFAPDVIDNEHLGRRKSNCCCIYRKPYKFDESSSSTDDETENCFGHTKQKKNRRCHRSNNEVASMVDQASSSLVSLDLNENKGSEEPIIDDPSTQEVSTFGEPDDQLSTTN